MSQILRRLLVAAFVLLALLYSVTTPIFEASDEVWHFPVIKHIADGEGLPVQVLGTRYSDHQLVL